MQKVKIASILIISSLLLISVGNFTIAQDSSYVGISEDEEYIWDLGLNKAGVISLIDDSEAFVQELLNNISTYDLGAYTDLNTTEAILLGYGKSFDLINEIFTPGLIPNDWKTINISTFLENLFDNGVETFNSSYLSGAIPSDWKSGTIMDFFDHVIEGISLTIPGFDNFTLSEILETVINIVNDTIPCDLLPVGWEDMPISNLIEFYLGKPANFINTTILPGLIPSDWLYMDLVPLLQNIFPILPQTLIDQLNASYAPTLEFYGEFSIFTIIEMYFNISGLIPGNWDDYTISELVFPILFQGYEEYNASYLLDEFFELFNNSLPYDLYSVNMSYLINETIYANTLYMPIELQSAPTIDLLRNVTSAMVLAMNSTIIGVAGLPPNWISLSMDELRDSYVNEAQILFDEFMVQVESYLHEFELLGVFEKLGLKATIDHIGDEVALYPGGPKGVPLNITIAIKVPFSDWVNITDIVGLDIFQYYQIYILDPATFSVHAGALVEQFLSTGGLFIGTGYDWSGIVTEYEIPGPASGKSINYEMDWTNNGVLDHYLLEYGGQVVASIVLQSTEPELISGYDLIIFTGITLFSMGALLISIKKKKTKF